MKNRGLWGENKAVEFLKAKNYTILARKNNIIFVEIKIRKNTAFGFPAEFVDYQKQQKIMKTAQLYINDNLKGAFEL